MKKNFRIVLALVLSIMMVLCSVALADPVPVAGDSVPVANGADDPVNPNPENDRPTSTGDVAGSITIQNPQTVGNIASTYNAYKIFDVTYEDGTPGDAATVDLYAYTITDDTENNSDWFSILTDSNRMTTSDNGKTYTGLSSAGFGGLKFTKTAADAVKYVVEVDNSFSAPAFAKALQLITLITPKPAADTTINTPDGTTLKASNLDLGYWFVTTTTGTLCNLTTIHPDEIIYDKNEVPKVDKSILEDVDADGDIDEVKNNNAAIGDVIAFKLDTKVPSMVGYDKYFFIVKDTFSKGLKLVDNKDKSVSDANSKYYQKDNITVTIAAGDPAADLPAITLKRVYLKNGKYYLDSECTKSVFVDGKEEKGTRELTSDAAGLTLDDDNNLVGAFYVNYHENKTDNASPFNSYDSSDTVPAGESRMEIVFIDMIQYLDSTNGTNNAGTYNESQEGSLGSADTTLGYTGSAITIKYFAEVDKDAMVDDAGNPNTAKITYSNDPTETGAGDNTPDEPKDDKVVGDGPKSETNTFVTGIKITKVDGIDITKTLAGAKFQLKSSNLLNTVIQNGIRYEASPYNLIDSDATDQSADGMSIDGVSKVVYAKETWADGDSSDTYYLLKDGTYTTTAQTADTANLYEDGNATYVKVRYTWVVEKEAAGEEPAEHIAITGQDGIVYFAGLKAGTYTVTELQAPDGYNMLTNDITVTISVVYKDANDANIDVLSDTDKAKSAVWTATISGLGNTQTINLNSQTSEEQGYSQDVIKLLPFTVKNNRGALLPSTGGIGTTIFYVGGSLMVLAAAILLITKRRMGAED